MVPFPLQGCITPHLQLAQHLISSYDFFVTFVNTTYNHERLMGLQAAETRQLESSSRIKFVHVPDGLPEDDNRGGDLAHVRAAMVALEPVFVDLFQQLLNESPVTCIIRDVYMPSAHKPATKLGIPVIGFSTMSAVTLWCLDHVETYFAEGLLPLPAPPDHQLAKSLQQAQIDEEAAMHEHPITCVPGVPPFVKVKHLPSAFLENDVAVIKHFTQFQNPLMHECDLVLLNTFEELEALVLEAMQAKGFNVCPVGPLLFSPSFNVDGEAAANSFVSQTSSTLWLEDETSLVWLDQQKPSTVTFVSFGSIATMSIEQIWELACGLEMSNQPFLWVIRPDLIRQEDSNSHAQFLTSFSSFVERIKGQALMVPWVPQMKVLSHPSISAFLTHCGWNSTLESISTGVPMLGWPFFSDQILNCQYITQEWKIGVDFERQPSGGLILREEISRKVRAMHEEVHEVNLLRTRAKELQKVAQRTRTKGGSSQMNMATFIEHIGAHHEAEDLVQGIGCSQ